MHTLPRRKMLVFLAEKEKVFSTYTIVNDRKGFVSCIAAGAGNKQQLQPDFALNKPAAAA